MIKQITLIHKKPGLSDEEFNRHWREIHGPMFAKAPALRRYVQNHFVGLPGVKYEGDGIAETWFDDLESQRKLEAWIRSKDAKEVLDDAVRFVSGSESVWFVEENVILDNITDRK
jgi:uncharacterized protein (TIGR02118 family)